MAYFFVAGGLLILLLGGEILTRGAVNLSKRFKLSAVFIGIVVVGFGTSLPEMAIGVDAVLQNAPGLAIGNAIGSNISNILFILAVAAMIRPFNRSERSLFPDGFILVAVSAGVVALGIQGIILPWQGAIMVVLLVCYLTFEYISASRKKKQLAKITDTSDSSDPYEPSNIKEIPLALAIIFIILGLLGLVAGAHILIEGATQIARDYKIPEEVIGLSILAVGTSLPELASAAMAAYRGQSDLAYGNIYGSNLFNLLGILGVAAIVGPLTFPEKVLLIDGPLMIAATCLMLFCFWTGKGLSRIEGLIMFGVYVSYIYLRYTVL